VSRRHTVRVIWFSSLPSLDNRQQDSSRSDRGAVGTRSCVRGPSKVNPSSGAAQGAAREGRKVGIYATPPTASIMGIRSLLVE
jgi:hypothetical protein